MTVEQISKTLENAIQLCNSISGLSLDNIALYVTYEETQYKLKGIDSLKHLLETPIIDRPNWQSYFHTNPYLGVSIYETLAALYYKTQGYKV